MKPKDVKNHGPKENFLDELIKTADKIMNRAEMGNRVSNLSPPEFSSFRDKILRGERAEPPVPAGRRTVNRLAHMVGDDAFTVIEKNLPQMEKIVPGIVERVSQSREPLYTGY
ncbi:MAG: hypothetical protein HZB23_15225 [Deltaproteobacteria bacterium]|nr:hypothetical protein [Deltaproteobacteria bacterium]